MAFNYSCFKDCVKGKLKWYTWVAIGVLVITAFLLAFFSWGLSIPASIAWAAGAFGGSIALVLVTCFMSCK